MNILKTICKSFNHAPELTQQRILLLFRSKDIITLPEILDLRIANYSQRIAELRQLGFDIVNNKQYYDRKWHSIYRLVK